MVGVDLVAICQVDDSFDEVPQFADVTGPGMSAQSFAGSGGQRKGFAPGLATKVSYEMFCEQQDIVATIAQRGQFQGHDVQSKIEVFPKLFFGDHLGQVLVGGGDDACVGGDRFGAAHADDDFFLEGPQQLRLSSQAEVTDFVQEQRAAGRQFEFTDSRIAGVGESAFFVSEQFAFQQSFRDGGAVDCHKRLGAVGA